MPLQLSCIGQISITVRDLGRAVAFYRDTLGMRLLFEVPPKMAFFDCGGMRLMLAVPEEPEFDHPSSILYYKVNDIHGAWQGLTGAGVDLRREPHLVARMQDQEVWMAFFRDSEGNTLALLSEVRQPAG
ncbi:MAG TPA: VOC family protein [Thermoanaerobaculia bacterium]|jgi:methylmalonyl-CoA/ethylmalonyl-CoA epimerase|nr:VOC family protein [Thermoanaerobaculia bacterium]